MNRRFWDRTFIKLRPYRVTPFFYHMYANTFSVSSQRSWLPHMQLMFYRRVLRLNLARNLYCRLITVARLISKQREQKAKSFWQIFVCLSCVQSDNWMCARKKQKHNYCSDVFLSLIIMYCIYYTYYIYVYIGKFNFIFVAACVTTSDSLFHKWQYACNNFFMEWTFLEIPWHLLTAACQSYHSVWDESV